MAAPQTGGTRPLLELAAESLAAEVGLSETVVDVLHGRALSHYAEGLRQHLIIQSGQVEAGTLCFDEVRTAVAGHSAEDLVRPPGIRARLYRLAHETLERHREKEPSRTERAELPWRPPRGTAARTNATAIRYLRTGMAPEHAELLELRYARELSPEELAHVVGRDVETIDGELLQAMADLRATAGYGPLGQTDALRGVILEAFALEADAHGSQTAAAEAWQAVAAGTIIGGRYEIESRVGSGSFSDVYRAKDTDVEGHIVALKLLHQPSLSDQAKHDARRELNLIASVTHPSIVQFKDHGWFESRLWFVMPWYEGETLEARIERAPLTRPQARRIFEPLTRALATMHEAGIRHQDIKPDNIFLARIRGFGSGEHEEVLPVLLDLGVAAKEAEMVVAGTPTYFAPEVAAQFAALSLNHAVTPKADVFSLALSLRNALEPSSQDDIVSGAVEAFIEQRARNLPALPQNPDLAFLKAHWERWLSLDPEARPSADELADELSVLTRPEERRERRIRILRWVVPLILVLGTAFASMGYVLQNRAELQRLEAERARLEAAAVRADLTEESARRRELEQDVEQIRERYESSRLTRQELASKLATTEQDLRTTSEGLSRERRTSLRLRTDLGASEARGLALDAELTETKTQLGLTQGELAEVQTSLALEQTALRDERARATSLAGDIERLRGELASATEARNAQASRIAELEAALSQGRAALATAEGRAARLEQQAANLTRNGERLERQLTQARTRITRLEQQLVRRGDRPAPEPQPEAPPAGEPPVDPAP